MSVAVTLHAREHYPVKMQDGRQQKLGEEKGYFKLNVKQKVRKMKIKITLNIIINKHI